MHKLFFFVFTWASYSSQTGLLVFQEFCILALDIFLEAWNYCCVWIDYAGGFSLPLCTCMYYTVLVCRVGESLS